MPRENEDVLRNVEESLNLIDKSDKACKSPTFTPPISTKSKSYKGAGGTNPVDSGNNTVNYLAGNTNCPLLPEQIITTAFTADNQHKDKMPKAILAEMI